MPTILTEAVANNTLLDYAIATNPDPLQSSPASGNPSVAALSIVVSNGSKESIFCQKIVFSFEIGDQAQYLTNISGGILCAASPSDQWQISGTSEGVFTATPVKPQYNKITTNGLVFQIYNIQVNQQVGTCTFSVDEYASTDNTTFNRSSNAYTLAKFPYGFFVSNFTASIPQVNNGQTATLTWLGADLATYTILSGSQAPVDVTNVRSWTTKPLTQDTSFILKTSVQEQGETVNTYLSTVVTVANPSIIATSIGIGTTAPRTNLDIGNGMFSGAANDYYKAQLALSGGGTVTWGGGGGRLKWTQRFLAVSISTSSDPSHPSPFLSGYVNLGQPTADIPAEDVYDGQARSVTKDGVLLNIWEALYAVHGTIDGHGNIVGGGVDNIVYKIVRYTAPIFAPTNWLLVAVVNGDDNTVKLGTGVILSARTISVKSSPIPSGTILMWSWQASAVPDGWSLCDGQNGTPDLRSRFLVGAGAASPYDPVNAKGEASQHNHDVQLPATTFSSVQNDGQHTHSMPSAWYDRDALRDISAAGKQFYNAIDRGGNSIKDAQTPAGGAHNHQISVHFSVASATTTGDHRPKWYAIYYIMKL